MKTQMSELTPSELQHITGGGEWWGIGTIWSIGGATLGIVAGVAGSLAVAPAIIIVAGIAGVAFAASGTMVLMMDSHMDAQVAQTTGASEN